MTRPTGRRTNPLHEEAGAVKALAPELKTWESTLACHTCGAFERYLKKPFCCVKCAKRKAKNAQLGIRTARKPKQAISACTACEPQEAKAVKVFSEAMALMTPARSA